LLGGLPLDTDRVPRRSERSSPTSSSPRSELN
jgi:hypothetical protein